MQVRVEVSFDDTELSIQQQDVLTYSSSGVRSDVAVLTMGRCVGKMIAALSAGSTTPIDVLIEEFHETVLRSARSAAPGSEHTCDQVGCC